MANTKSEKHCRFCKRSGLPLMKSSKTDDNQYYSCRDCNNDIRHEWYSKPANKLKQAEYNRKYLEKKKALKLLEALSK